MNSGEKGRRVAAGTIREGRLTAGDSRIAVLKVRVGLALDGYEFDCLKQVMPEGSEIASGQNRRGCRARAMIGEDDLDKSYGRSGGSNAGQNHLGAYVFEMLISRRRSEIFPCVTLSPFVMWNEVRTVNLTDGRSRPVQLRSVMASPSEDFRTGGST